MTFRSLVDEQWFVLERVARIDDCWAITAVSSDIIGVIVEGAAGSRKQSSRPSIGLATASLAAFATRCTSSLRNAASGRCPG